MWPVLDTCSKSSLPSLSLVLVIALPCLDVRIHPLSKASLDLCSLCVPNL